MFGCIIQVVKQISRRRDWRTFRSDMCYCVNWFGATEWRQNDFINYESKLKGNELDEILCVVIVRPNITCVRVPNLSIIDTSLNSNRLNLTAFGNRRNKFTI